MVKQQISNLRSGVRFSYPAPNANIRKNNMTIFSSIKKWIVCLVSGHHWASYDTKLACGGHWTTHGSWNICTKCRKLKRYV